MILEVIITNDNQYILTWKNVKMSIDTPPPEIWENMIWGLGVSRGKRADMMIISHGFSLLGYNMTSKLTGFQTILDPKRVEIPVQRLCKNQYQSV